MQPCQPLPLHAFSCNVVIDANRLAPTLLAPARWASPEAESNTRK